MRNIAIVYIVFIFAVALAYPLEEDRILTATGDLTLPSSGLILNSDIKLYYEINSGTLSLMLEV